MCGYVPAAEVTFTQDMLVFRRAKALRIRACRDCGTAVYRSAQSNTLLTGWWGVVSAVMNIAHVWGNFKERRTLDALGEPRPPRERTTRAPRTSPLPVAMPTLLRPKWVQYPVDCTDGLANARVVAILPSSSDEADCPRTTDGVTHSDRFGVVCWDSL